MEEDFIIEEGGETPSNRRPFLIAVGVLLSILVISVICSVSVLNARNNGENGGNAEEIAAIETQNAITELANQSVTQTIIAMETEEARPTETPPPPATNTPAPTNTLRPTNTPVIRPADDADGTATPELEDGADSSAETGADTPTPVAPLGGANGGSDDEALPQTGIGTWSALVAALGLIAVLIAARRLRTG